MPISPLQGLPPLPFPAIPSSYDESLSFMELLCKIWNACSELITAQNATAAAVTQLQSDVFQLQEQIGDVPQLAADVAQLQTDIAAEIQNRQTQYDSLYAQINGVRNMVIADYVSNDDLADVLAGGIKFILISAADYAELTEYDSSTIYAVIGSDSRIKFYFRGQTANCCAPSVWPDISSSDFAMTDSQNANTAISCTLSNVDAGKLLIGVVSSYGAPTAEPGSEWALIESGTLASEPGRNIYVYSKTATAGTNTFGITTSAGTGSGDETAIYCVAIPDATTATVTAKQTEIVFTNNETELDTTADAHRLYIYFTDSKTHGVQLPSPAPDGLTNANLLNYSLARMIYQYKNTAETTTLTGVSVGGDAITGKFDLWTVSFA